VTADLAALRWPRQTARLTLRPAVLEDAPAIQAYRGVAEVTRYLGHGTGELVGDGTLGLKDAAAHPIRRSEVRLAEGWIGYCIAPAWSGRGLATELARALVGLALGDLGLRRVVAHAYTEHVASRRVLEKAGLRREATFRKKVLADEGRWMDDDVWALLREEWSDRPQ